MKTKIKVTQDDINYGICSCLHCPIALAIHRQTSFLDARVFVQGWRKSWSSICNTLPRSAQRFIKRFDSKQPVKPFNFFLTD